MPLWLRISATEWMEYAGEPSWDVEQSIQLAKLLPGLGIDLLDVSSGGNMAAQQLKVHPYYQVSIAGRIREELKTAGLEMLIGAVGMITEAEMAKSIVQGGKSVVPAVEGVSSTNGPSNETGSTVEVEDENGHQAQADLVLVAKQFLRDPHWVITVADQLGVDIKTANQYHRVRLAKRPPKV